MSDELKQTIAAEVEAVGGDRTRLLDVVKGVQARLGQVDSAAIDEIARQLDARRVEVAGVVSFYHFFSEQPQGQVVIHLSDCVPCMLAGAKQVAAAFEEVLGIAMGGLTADGRISIGWTSCIGLCDHGPAALINGLPFLGLTPGKARSLAEAFKSGDLPEHQLKLPPRADALERARALVPPGVRERGPVVFAYLHPGRAIKNALKAGPTGVISMLKGANLCGRGGAGFPTGLKWQFARGSEGDRKVIICNADEGEPGTFKDRAILMERPGHVIEGMTVAGLAVGAEEGIIYLRAEYEWLLPRIEAEIAERRKSGLLGQNVAGTEGFHFDLRVQLGAGAYVCGEESALIESCEGKRGCPRHRPPFPVQVGYLGLPTVVNNVETFAVATSLLHDGYASVARLGSGQSCGTKLYSVSGDCSRPGVWELPFGLTVTEFLQTVGGEGAVAVQVGGPSGRLVPPTDFGKHLSFEELATGGSMVVFGPDRDLLEVVSSFMAFFIEESCGWCVPCRVGNQLLKERLDRIRAGKGLPEDIPYLKELGATVKKTSRCGLGQTSPNPVLTAIEGFPKLFADLLVAERDRGRQPAFDFEAAMAEAVKVQGREPVFHGEEGKA
jgi:[NiFe] hydrogenase diaphorase moiety large subunit